MSNDKPSKREDALGWLAAFIMLLAYILSLSHLMSVQSVAYILMNFVGGAELTYIAFRYKNYQLVLVNGVWAIASAVALLGSLVK